MMKLYNNKGYTLLFAALTAALVLGVAVFILSVSRKQFILASTARDSTYSIYAADSGIECVALKSGDISSTTFSTAGETILDCNGRLFVLNPTGRTSHDAFKADDIWFKQVEGYIGTSYSGNYVETCAKIVITTGLDSEDVPKTVYDSSGYNVCTGTDATVEPNFNSPRTVERALRLTYLGVW